MIPTLRILTRKTKLRFGRWKDYTVQDLLDLRKQKELISPYYKLTPINYTEDILIELKITKDYRIEKPGTDREMSNLITRTMSKFMTLNINQLNK